MTIICKCDICGEETPIGVAPSTGYYLSANPDCDLVQDICPNCSDYIDRAIMARVKSVEEEKTRKELKCKGKQM